MLKLVIEDDEGRKTTVPLVRTEVTIGRREGNTIRLTERNVSRNHARIVKEDGKYFLSDLSRYGTRKNGKRVPERLEFREGDVVIIGDYRLILRRDDPDATVPGLVASAPPPARKAAGTPPKLPVAASTAEDLGERGRLVCLTEPFGGSEFVFVGDDMVIGRGADCELIIDHASISKRHARIIRTGGSYRIEDQGSSNKVFVNDAEVSNHTFVEGDSVELGALQFRYVSSDSFWVYEPLVEEVPGSNSAWIKYAIGGAVALLLVIVIVAVSGGNSTDEVATGGVDETVEPPITQDDGEIPTPESLMADGRGHMNEGRWETAIDLFAQVPPDHREFELAQSLVAHAEGELGNRAVYEDILALQDGADYRLALVRISEIQVGTYYRARLEDEGRDDDILNAYIDERIAASQSEEDGGNLEQAYEIVHEVEPIAPDNMRIRNRIADLQQRMLAEDAGEAVEQEIPEREDPRRDDPRPDREDEEDVEDVEREDETEEPELSDDEVDARVDELISQARRAGVQQNHRDAITVLEEARELDRRNSEVNIMLYRNYVAIGATSRAASALRRHLSRNPNDPRRAEWEQWLADNDPE